MTTARILSVVIPHYQRDAGILGRALKSVQAQDIPEGWQIEVIVVDDGSPRPAKDELTNITFTPPSLRLKVIEQENGGVAVARNRGLDTLDPESEIIAFLDSDDIWSAEHLRKIIVAIEQGFDFYFCDNKRAGHHQSHCNSSHTPRMAEFLKGSIQKTGYINIDPEFLSALTLSEFPAQASTVGYRADMARELRFATFLKSSEDVLFFMELLSKAKKCCYDADDMTECGSGVNIYFSNLDWNKPEYMAIKKDQIISYAGIYKLPNLPLLTKKISQSLLKKAIKDFVYLAIRSVIKNKGRLPHEFSELVKTQRAFMLQFPAALAYVLFGKLFGFYKL